MPARWHDRERREAYLEASIEQGIAWQIRINREERGWTQPQLAEKFGCTQPMISRLEDEESENSLNVATLIKLANAFDCALQIKFIGFQEFAESIHGQTPERLYAASFSDESSGTSLGGLPIQATNQPTAGISFQPIQRGD